MAFSPNNKMLATGGQEMLCIWQLCNDLEGQIQPLKYFQKPPHFFSSKMSGGVGTTVQASNNMSRDNFQSEFS